MAGSRFFIKVDQGFPEHPQTIILSDKAFRTVVEFWCYCHRNTTDGKVPRVLFDRLPAKVRKELLTHYVQLHDDHVLMHDYVNHQQTAESIEEALDKKREAGRKGGLAKARNLANAKAPAKATGKQAPSEALLDIDIDIDIDLKNSLENEFIDFYLTYPRKEARAPAVKAYEKARKTTPAAVILAGVERYAKSVAGKERQFIALPATWLNAQRWEDDLTPAAGAPSLWDKPLEWAE